ncbi:hypothetical protein C451_04631 [Halococcus thailandensis JCM 13552]|uniref:Uncharacterized protein n=1 Tax=Halococcus thailandensis JCM 13552 TaxID=1227457 RepID=M0NDW0_9EURY|nr:hypothetical protein C451_04631 [Halococcus thailandensis JCM 13552]
MTLNSEAERLVINGPPATPRFDLLDRESFWKCDIVSLEKSYDGVTISEIQQIRIVRIGITICHAGTLYGLEQDSTDELTTVRPGADEGRCQPTGSA